MFRIKNLFYEFSSPRMLELHKEVPTVTFRGAFGYALAQLIAREACIPELGRQVELYRRVFMPRNDGTQESRNLDLARPFQLRGFYSRSDHCSYILQLQLFGVAAEHETFFDRVMEIISYMGLGWRNQVCHFEKLNAQEATVDDPDPTDSLEVYFLTPCVRLKHHGRIYRNEIPFQALLPRLIDRTTELDNLYGDGSFEREWDIAGMKRAAAEIWSSYVAGEAQAARRTSGRTGQSMNLDGFVGEMNYLGDFTPFREALRYLSHLNIGRFNVFGCGWCRARYRGQDENKTSLETKHCQ